MMVSKEESPRKALVGSLVLNASVFLTFWVGSLWWTTVCQNLRLKSHFDLRNFQAPNLKSEKKIGTFCVFFQTLWQGRKFLRISSREKKKFHPLGVIEKASPRHHIKKEEEALLVQMGVRGEAI